MALQELDKFDKFLDDNGLAEQYGDRWVDRYDFKRDLECFQGITIGWNS